jgi:hypothetical protein
VLMDGGRNRPNNLKREQTARDRNVMQEMAEDAEPRTSEDFDFTPKRKVRKLRPISHKGNQEKQDPNVFKAWVDLAKEASVEELARVMGTSAAYQAIETPFRKAEATDRTLPVVRARRATTRDSRSVPAALLVPAGIAVTDQMRARGPTRMGERDLSRLTAIPQTELLEESPDTELELQDLPYPRVRAGSQSGAATPRSASARLHDGQTTDHEPRFAPIRRRLPARLVTPTGLQLCVRPEGPPALVPNPARRPSGFYALEITTRQGGRLVDVATLYDNKAQYILGYPTPQGAKAPSCGHLGLRMLKINADRSVDLVFPRDSAGTLIRDGERVKFVELSQGRKYSSVRLIPTDEVTLILNSKGKQLAYCVRFLQKDEA